MNGCDRPFDWQRAFRLTDIHIEDKEQMMRVISRRVTHRCHVSGAVMCRAPKEARAQAIRPLTD
jgi:hypothetical protein